MSESRVVGIWALQFGFTGDSPDIEGLITVSELRSVRGQSEADARRASSSGQCPGRRVQRRSGPRM